MIVKFYTNLSDPRALDKNITEIATLTGALREEADIMSPSVLFEGDITAYSAANYLYITELGRYYFIDSLESVRNGLFRANCHVDVLSTYKDGIRANTAILARSERVWDLYLDDGSFKVDNNPHIMTKSFPSGFNQMSFVLAVADGGAGNTTQTTETNTEGNGGE